MMVKCNIDRTQYQSKPDSKETGKIQSRLANNCEEVSIRQLAELCGSGCTHRPALLSGTTGDTWESQQLIELDFDHDTTIDEQLTRCADLGIIPAFGYTSFSHLVDRGDSHGVEERFRLAFVLPSVTTDYRYKNLVYRALLQLFPKADQVTTDPGRLFYGGHSYFIIDEDSMITPFNVVMQAQAVIRQRSEPSNNFPRAIKLFAEATGMKLVGNCLDIEVVDAESTGRYPIDMEWEIDPENAPARRPKIQTKNASIYINIIGAEAKIVSFLRVNFATSQEAILRGCTNGSRAKKGLKFDIDCRKAERKERKQRFDFNALFENCRLFAQALDGDIWCTHNEVFGMATNLQCVEGGESKLLGIIENICYEKQYGNLYNTIKYVGVRDYSPMQCTNFCPYAGNNAAIEGHKNGDLDDYRCCHKLNMLQMTDLKRLQIRQVSHTQGKDVDDLAENLECEVRQAYEKEDNLIYVIKAPTGVGKTEVLTRLNLKNTCIAGPTHKLGNELSHRLVSQGNELVHLFERPKLPQQLESIVAQYQKIGEHGAALKLIEEYCFEQMQLVMKQTKPESAERYEGLKSFDELRKYLKAREDARTASIVLCTHEKLFSLQNPHMKKVIVDEDIIQSCLLKVVEVSIEDLELLEGSLFTQGLAQEHLGGVITRLKNATSMISEMPTIDWSPYKKDIKAAIKQNNKELSTNVLDILSCRYYIKDVNKNKIFAIAKRKLDDNKQYIILSATANETIYRQLFGDRLRFIDLGQANMLGKVSLYPERGYSRRYLLNNHRQALPRFKEVFGNMNFITYKGWKKEFERAGLNVIATFGACSGIDSYGGQDLVVIGTPHANRIVYLLYAHALGYHVPISDQCDNSFDLAPIERNGYEFYFNTYANSQVLQEIQFYLIESELVQAVGRARALRNYCEVHLFSNYPIPGCVLAS